MIIILYYSIYRIILIRFDTIYEVIIKHTTMRHYRGYEIKFVFLRIRLAFRCRDSISNSSDTRV